MAPVFKIQQDLSNLAFRPNFPPLLMDKDMLCMIFESLRGLKQELYAKSFQVNDIVREKHLLALETHVVNLKRDAKICLVTPSG